MRTSKALAAHRRLDACAAAAALTLTLTYRCALGGTEPGACCFSNGTCGVMDPADCLAGGGIFQGDGTICAVGLCEQPAGGCCFPDGSCLELTQADCNAMGANWQGMFTECVEGLCIPVKGACCFADGACTVVTETLCADMGGEWMGDDTVCTLGLCTQAAQADFNHDGVVDVGDMVMLISDWGCSGDCPGDLDGDDQSGGDDLLILLMLWGPVP